MVWKKKVTSHNKSKVLRFKLTKIRSLDLNATFLYHTFTLRKEAAFIGCPRTLNVFGMGCWDRIDR